MCEINQSQFFAPYASSLFDAATFEKEIQSAARKAVSSEKKQVVVFVSDQVLSDPLYFDLLHIISCCKEEESVFRTEEFMASLCSSLQRGKGKKVRSPRDEKENYPKKNSEVEMNEEEVMQVVKN